MDKLYEFLVRFRTWLFNLALTVLIVAPDILNSPEVLAIIPADYQRWVLASAFLVNIWMRPRPAVMAKDPEAQK
jgi:hypothetical protein